MFTLQDLATLVALMKQYRNELVRNAYDELELNGNDDLDVKDLADKVESLDKALEVAMDDFEYRIKNY